MKVISKFHLTNTRNTFAFINMASMFWYFGVNKIAVLEILVVFISGPIWIFLLVKV